MAESSLPKVLYLEDDDISREVVSRFLKDICNVDTAADSSSAFDKIKIQKYDAILVDMNLGRGPSGLEFVKQLIESPQYHHEPLIAVTAYAMKEDEQEILSAGCTHYISKPFDRSSLKRLVKSALDESHGNHN